MPKFLPDCKALMVCHRTPLCSSVYASKVLEIVAGNREQLGRLRPVDAVRDSVAQDDRAGTYDAVGPDVYSISDGRVRPDERILVHSEIAGKGSAL